MNTRAELLLQGRGDPIAFPLDVARFTIGRDAQNSMCLPDQVVSRYHAEIVQVGRDFLFRDRGSTNGTYINETRISEQVLVDGDTIRFGKAGPELRFHYLTGAEESTEPSPKTTEDLIGSMAARLNTDPGSAPEEASLRCILAESHLNKGEDAEALALLVKYRDPDALDVLPVRLRAEVLLGLGQVEAVQKQYTSGVRTLEKALKLATECGDDGLRAGAYVALGRCFLGKDEFMVARDHLHRALLAARRAGNGRYRTEAHLLIGKVDWNEGDLEGARYNWTRAGRLAEGAVEPLLLARARLQEAFILYAEGVVKEALPAYHHAIELIREVGHVKILLKAYSGLSRLLTRSGSWVATESLLEERLQLARQHNLGKAEAVALTDLAELRFLQGNVAAAANVINMALERHGKTIYARTQRILARILRARGQKTEAYEALAAGLAAASRKGALEEQVLIGIESALHRVEDGQLAEARRTLDEAEAITSLDPALNLMGRVLYVRGRIHLDDGQQREANRCFTQSLAIFQNVGDPLRTAMCHVAIAELRAQSGRAASARAHLEEAERSYAKLGAGDMLRDVQAKIASLHLEKVQPQMTQMLTLTAPLSMANVPTIALPETPTAAEPPRPCRVLVAETDEAMVKLLKNGLEVENYLVEHVQSGRDALERAIGGDYDFLIVDALLEHRSGFDVCRDLRKRALDAPVIMLGGRLGIEDKIEALQAGADDFIPKQSLVFEELLAKMEALLR